MLPASGRRPVRRGEIEAEGRAADDEAFFFARDLGAIRLRGEVREGDVLRRTARVPQSSPSLWGRAFHALRRCCCCRAPARSRSSDCGRAGSAGGSGYGNRARPCARRECRRSSKMPPGTESAARTEETDRRVRHVDRSVVRHIERFRPVRRGFVHLDVYDELPGRLRVSRPACGSPFAYLTRRICVSLW